MSEPARDFEVHQEDDQVATRSVIHVALVGVLTGAAGVFCAGVLLVASTGALRPNVAGPDGTRPSAPEISKIEQTPIRDTRRGLDLREAQRRELERWTWVDRSAGVATIPIDTAIDIVVERGQ
jgi:hypothetical protein